MHKSDIQSVVFERKYWTKNNALNWLHHNGLKPLNGVDLIHPKQYRYRIRDPRLFKYFISKKLDHHIMLIIGFY